MNILFLTTHLNAGGITSYLLTLVKGLVANNVGVLIISAGGQRVDEFHRCGAKHIQMNIRTKSEISPKVYLSLPTIARLIDRNGIDLIHSQTRITQVIGQILSNWKNIPYVSTAHGFFKNERFSRQFAPCWGDATIAISPAVEQHLLYDFSLEREKVHLVKNGIDIGEFPLLSEEQRQRKRKQLKIEHTPVLGIIARLSDVKGHSVLIEAMPKILKRFPTAGLIIVGRGKEEQNIKDLIDKKGISRHVDFFPVVNRTAELLPLFDIFIMPSLNEGLGLSILEAQAVGLPVVASAVGGIPGIIKDKQTGYLVEPNNSDKLAEAIINILNDPDSQRSVGQRARDFIVKEYSKDGMVEGTLNVYRKVLEKRTDEEYSGR